MAIAPERTSDAPIYEGTHIPAQVPTMLKPSPGLEDVLTVNFGPNHPSTHGVLRLIVDLQHGRNRARDPRALVDLRCALDHGHAYSSPENRTGSPPMG